MAFLRAFKVAHWVRRKIEEIPKFWESAFSGGKQGRRAVCGRDGWVRSRGQDPEVGRAVRSGIQNGVLAEVTGAVTQEVAKMGFPLGASRGSSTRSQLGHQSNMHPWVVVSPIGAHMSVLPKRLAHLLTHNQSSHHMPYASAPITCHGLERESHSYWKQSSESV